MEQINFAPITKSDLKRANRLLRLIGLFKIRMIGYARPIIIELTDSRVVIRLKLNRRNKNHYNTMYLGALAIGADLASGFLAFYLAHVNKIKTSLLFKSYKSEFLRRPDGDVYFVAATDDRIQQMIRAAVSKSERVTETIPVEAYVNYTTEPILVAKFELELSIKKSKES